MIYAATPQGKIVTTSRKRALRYGLHEVGRYAEAEELRYKIAETVDCSDWKAPERIPRALLRRYWQEIKQARADSTRQNS